MLYPRIAKHGHEVLLATRWPYVHKPIESWHGVKLIHCFAPQSKYCEAIVQTFIALLKAHQYLPDIVHIHAIGPSIFTPLARRMGLKVVMTDHGPDYHRQKWCKIAKCVLSLGEKVGGLYANEVIAISSVISEIICARCHREPHLIYNGISLPKPSKKIDFLKRLEIEPDRYFLAVARFVPEKGLHDLIEAFTNIESNYKLVVVGEADHETNYSRSLRQQAAKERRIVLTGYITGEPLNQLYTNAHLFILPSYHEGLPIVLLEALSYGIPVLVSDIPANKEVELPANRYFRCGDVADLKSKIETLKEQGWSVKEQQIIHRQIVEKYDWDKIAEKTIRVYEKALD